MQFEKAKTISENWEKRKKADPSLTCSHTNLEKEYYLGTATGDYVCTNCGESFTWEEKKAL